MEPLFWNCYCMLKLNWLSSHLVKGDKQTTGKHDFIEIGWIQSAILRTRFNHDIYTALHHAEQESSDQAELKKIEKLNICIMTVIFPTIKSLLCCNLTDYKPKSFAKKFYIVLIFAKCFISVLLKQKK